MTQANILTSNYLCNPDVVLREEDEDGGLLFNPDTNQLKVINTTGLFIWKQCENGADVSTISIALAQTFEEAPTEKVADDIKEFLDILLQFGYITIIVKS